MWSYDYGHNSPRGLVMEKNMDEHLQREIFKAARKCGIGGKTSVIGSQEDININLKTYSSHSFKRRYSELNRNNDHSKFPNDFKISNFGKPQLSWTDIDNSEEPFKIKLKVKHNAIIPYCPESYETIKDKFKLKKRDVQSIIEHPYFYEITNLPISKSLLEIDENVKVNQLDAIPLLVVDNVDDLQLLFDELINSTVFAVDLEHHNMRSYLGITCLIQISTINKDFLIDCIKLRNDIHILNDPFTNPSILKIFHGSDMDIHWLQRDFGIYVVNMFDTGRASRVLSFPKFSLAFLLNKYCDIVVDKTYQMADWRVRPLSKELIKYAREDTHYLIYVYEQIKKEALSKKDGESIMKTIFNDSKEVCLRVYKKPQQTNPMKIITKFNMANDKVDLINKVCKWRENVARSLDESPGFIMPNYCVSKICLYMPKNIGHLLNLFRKTPNFSYENAVELLKILESPCENAETFKIASQTNKFEPINKNIENTHKKSTKSCVSAPIKSSKTIEKDNKDGDNIVLAFKQNKVSTKHAMARLKAIHKVPTISNSVIASIPLSRKNKIPKNGTNTELSSKRIKKPIDNPLLKSMKNRSDIISLSQKSIESIENKNIDQSLTPSVKKPTFNILNILVEHYKIKGNN